MKKLLFLLVFIPLLSFGQTGASKSQNLIEEIIKKTKERAFHPLENLSEEAKREMKDVIAIINSHRASKEMHESFGKNGLSFLGIALENEIEVKKDSNGILKMFEIPGEYKLVHKFSISKYNKETVEKLLKLTKEKFVDYLNKIGYNNRMYLSPFNITEQFSISYYNHIYILNNKTYTPEVITKAAEKQGLTMEELIAKKGIKLKEENKNFQIFMMNYNHPPELEERLNLLSNDVEYGAFWVYPKDLKMDVNSNNSLAPELATSKAISFLLVEYMGAPGAVPPVPSVPPPPPVPQSKSQVKFYSTDYGIFDLKDEDMKYYLKNYIHAFLFDIGKPDIFMLLHYADETDVLAIRDYFNTTMHSKLNKKDLEYINSFSFNDEKINVEYKSLDGEMLAYAVGNIFEDGEIRIVVDPKKMSDASSSKRAYIMYHELFHTLGIKHGECGLMMFPYVEKEYTWDDFTHGKIQAHECFVTMRNKLAKSKN